MDYACVAGIGAIGPVHINGINESDNVKLYAVCDINTEKLKEFKNKYKCETYSDFDTMLNDGNITSVHICTPHYLHYEMARKALTAGKKVILEKPVTMKKDEFLKLYDLSDKYPDKLCIMFQNRTCNCVKTMKNMCIDKTKIKGIYASLTWNRDMNYYNHDEWRGKWETEGGGVLINQSVHLIDLVSYIGGEIKKVKGSISTKLLDIEVEDTADALFMLDNGARACFYATNAYSINSPFRLEIAYDDYILKYENQTLYKIKDNEIKIIDKDVKGYEGKTYWGIGHKIVISNFYNGGEYPTIKNSKNTMNTLFAIYESAKNGKEVCL